MVSKPSPGGGRTSGGENGAKAPGWEAAGRPQRRAVGRAGVPPLISQDGVGSQRCPAENISRSLRLSARAGSDTGSWGEYLRRAAPRCVMSGGGVGVLRPHSAKDPGSKARSEPRDRAQSVPCARCVS